MKVIMTKNQMADRLIEFWNFNDDLRHGYILISRNPYIFIHKSNGRTWHICDVRQCYLVVIQNAKGDNKFASLFGSVCRCGYKVEPKLNSKLSIIRNIKTLKLP